MALDWIPIAPEQVPHRRIRLQGGSVVPFTAVVIPVPLIDGRLAFLPTFPDRVPHHRAQGLWLPASLPDFSAALTPVSWLATYPSRSTTNRPASYRVAAWPSVFAPPPGEQVLIGQRLAWSPRYPGQVPHPPAPNMGGSFSAIHPVVAAAGERCVELQDQGLTTPVILQEGLTSPGITSEALTSPTILQEDLC